MEQLSVNYSKIFLPAFSNALLRLGEEKSHLLQFVPEPFETFSLLQVPVRLQETVERLEAICANDNSNDIAVAIGKVICSTLSDNSSSCSSIIKAVGFTMHSGLSGLGNLNEKVINSLEQAAGNVINSSAKAFEHVSPGAGGFFMI